jgi:hypothetical protein
MSTVLIYDTETTGVNNPKLPKPRMMKLGILLGDDKGKIISSASFLIHPSPAWVVQPTAVAIHKITVEECRLYGVTPAVALYLLEHAATRADIVVGFNEPFDYGIAVTESENCNVKLDSFLDRKHYCIMRTMTDLCRLPHINRRYSKAANQWKWPKLHEAYRFLFGKSLMDAHDPLLGDSRATYELYCTLNAIGVKLEEITPKTGGAQKNGGHTAKVENSSSTKT